MGDWSKFTKRISVNAPKERIYEALSTQRGIESWFLRLAEFSGPNGQRASTEQIGAGDRYLWAWHGWGDETNLPGDILEANGHDRVSFTFHDPMVVTISVHWEHGISVVELVQTGIAEDDDSRANYYVGCGEGWTFYLTNLKSILEGGLDLRNRDEKLRNLVNS